MTSNEIQVLASKTFQSLSTIQELYSGRNFIQFIDKNVFRNINSLAVLYYI
jgi:hypothetical protein